MPLKSREDLKEFDRDALEGGYIYARADRLSSTLANARMSKAILAATDFSGKRVIDLGCGDGAYTLELVTKGGAQSVLGVDPAAAAIGRANERASLAGMTNCSFRVADILDLDTKSESYDIALLRGVLHHAEDPGGGAGDSIGLGSNSYST